MYWKKKKLVLYTLHMYVTYEYENIVTNNITTNLIIYNRNKMLKYFF